jgi:hypothetical protein
VIGGGEGEQGERMMKAAAVGAEAQARGHRELMEQKRANMDNALRTASLAADVVGAGEQRNMQREQFDRQMAQRESETELEAAKAGFERGPAGEEAPQGPQARGVPAAEQPFPQQGAEAEPGSRASQLEAEMAKGEQQGTLGPIGEREQRNLQEQGGKKMEMDHRGRWRMTPEAKSAQEREAKRKDFEADTDRIRAMAYRQQLAQSAAKNMMEDNQEAYDEDAKRLAGTANDRQKQFDRLMKSENVSGEDWSDLEKSATEIEGMDATLMADIKAKNFSPRVKQHLRARIGYDALSSIVDSQGSTKFLDIDQTNPQWQAFERERTNVNMEMQGNPALAAMTSIRNTRDKMNFLNVMAAGRVLMGMARTPAGKGPGGMTPSTMGPGEPGAPEEQPAAPPAHSQQRPLHGRGVEAVRGARAAGATPNEALQKGQAADPTGQFGVPPRRPEYHEIRRAGL